MQVYVARGWFCGHIAADPSKLPFTFACSSDVDFQDGTKDYFISMANEAWTVAKTPILFNDIYDGEVLDNDGNFYTENLREVKQRIEFISNGGVSVYSPHFTFQGFGYV